MKDKVKTKEQLIAELVEMRQRVAELEVAETERKRAEEALKKQQEELQTILDSIPAMVFYKDQKNRVVGVNDAYARFIGLAKQDIVGTSAFDLTPNRELAEAYWRDDQEVIESGTPKRNIIEPLITDETRWFQTDKIPRRDKDGQVIGVIGFSTEITERRRAEEALRESEKRFRDLFESAPDAVFVQDFDGYVLDVNPAACRLHGIEREYLIGRNVTELVPPDKREEAARKSLQLAQGDRDYIESFSWTKDGRAVPVEIRGSRIDYSGEQAVLLHVRDITARKRAECAIEERQMYLEAVLGAAPDAIVTLDAHRRIVEWNPGAERLFGYSQQEVMGQNLDHLITNPDTLEEAAGLTQIIMSGKDVPPVETVRYHKDGSPVNVTVAGSPILVGDELIGVVAVYTDITARKRAEEALKEYSERLEAMVAERTAELQAQYAWLDAILDSTTDGIVVTNAEGGIVQANPVAQAWLTQTLSPEEADWLREAIQSVVTLVEEQPVELLELTGLDLELSAAMVAEEGAEKPTAAVVDIHDVSHLKALDRIKTRFITNISHELRTPVTTIKLYAHLMGQHPKKWDQYLDALAQEADHQAWLVEDILEISHLDAGRIEIKPCPTSLNELIKTTVVRRQVLAQERGLTLEHHLAEPGLVTLADPERMMQVLSNLAGNAIHYTPEGGKVVISTGAQEAEGRTWATVTVADTGMGIPEDELPHLFNRFFRGEKPRSMQISGIGLGLAIVKEIVELHGGRVTVQSQVDVGSTFTVWLPLND